MINIIYAAFVCLAQSDLKKLADCKGLVRRSPLLAITFAVFLFSLAGLPPLAGFTGKWFLFAAVLNHYAEDGGGWYVVLAIIAVLNTAVSLYYYVRIVRAMFIDEPVGKLVVRPKMTYQIMLGAFSAALILFGIWWTPIIDWTSKSLTFLQRG